MNKEKFSKAKMVLYNRRNNSITRIVAYMLKKRAWGIVTPSSYVFYKFKR
jgi:hypothetical protein